MIDFDDELEQAQARLERQVALLDTAVTLGQIGDAYLWDWYMDLSPEDRALFDARVAEIKAALVQLVESVANVKELFVETFQEAFQAITDSLDTLATELNKALGEQFLPVINKSKQYDPHNARAMWKWDPAKTRPNKRPFREVRYNQVPTRHWRNGRRGR